MEPSGAVGQNVCPEHERPAETGREIPRQDGQRLDSNPLERIVVYTPKCLATAVPSNWRVAGKQEVSYCRALSQFVRFSYLAKSTH